MSGRGRDRDAGGRRRDRGTAGFDRRQGGGRTEPEADPLFRLEGVEKGGRDGPILRDVSLVIPDGRVTTLVGPSGAGKTTLLRLLNRLEDPDRGRILFRERPLEAHDVRELRCRVGFVFQAPVLFPGTVRQNLREAWEIAGANWAGFEEAAFQALRRAELDVDLLERDSRELSVGQQQRVTLARVLVTDPDALLLDEPTSALDPPTAARLLRTVRRLVRGQGLTAVMATHRIGEARWISDHAAMMVAGELVEAGAADRVLHEPEHAETARFLRSGWEAGGSEPAAHDPERGARGHQGHVDSGS